MKKILFGMLAWLALAFYGCSVDEDCYNLSDAKTEFFWCPKMDSMVVDWMKTYREKDSVFFDTLADCVRFEWGYMPQNKLLKQCENDSLTSRFVLKPFADGGVFVKDSGMVSMWVRLHVSDDSNAPRSKWFSENIETVSFDLYGCTAFSCRDVTRIHAYAKYDKSFDVWLSPENFKIEENGSKPSDGYYRYHHFRLIVDSSVIKITIETRCDGSCHRIENSPTFPLLS